MTTTKNLRAHSADILRFDIANVLRLPALPAALPIDIIQRIAALTDKSAGPGQPWRWLGNHNSTTSYPRIGFKNQITGKRGYMNVHRVLMCIAEGRMLGRRELVLHAPGVPKWSVNPGQLRVGTHAENVADALADNRYRARMTKAEVLDVVHLHETEEVSMPALAHRFKVSHEAIARIFDGRTHSKLTGKARKPRKAKVS